mgnify:CR=1 FL=1
MVWGAITTWRECLNTQRFRVYENVGIPSKKPGPKSKWADLPLETIGVGDLIELPLSQEEVEDKLNGIRAYSSRVGNRLEKKYSVRVTEYGIGIWRIR